MEMCMSIHRFAHLPVVQAIQSIQLESCLYTCRCTFLWMCSCLCPCTCLCACICTSLDNVHTYVHTQVYADVHTHVYTHIYTYTSFLCHSGCWATRMSIYMSKHMSIHTPVTRADQLAKLHCDHAVTCADMVRRLGVYDFHLLHRLTAVLVTLTCNTGGAHL